MEREIEALGELLRDAQGERSCTGAEPQNQKAVGQQEESSSSDSSSDEDSSSGPKKRKVERLEPGGEVRGVHCG